MKNLSEVRKKAWESRRAKYGQGGHRGYRKRLNVEGMIALIIKLHKEEVLTEGQAARATGMHRIEIRKRVQESL
jgi:hypothetical protein